jgi:hypothetical protein
MSKVEDETFTVLAIGPDASNRVDMVTGGAARSEPLRGQGKSSADGSKDIKHSRKRTNNSRAEPPYYSPKLFTLI